MTGVVGSGVAEVEVTQVRARMYQCVARPGLQPVAVGVVVAGIDGRLTGVWSRAGRRLLAADSSGALLDALRVFLRHGGALR